VHGESGACWQQSQSQKVGVTRFELFCRRPDGYPIFGPQWNIEWECEGLNWWVIPKTAWANCIGGASVINSGVEVFTELTVKVDYFTTHYVMGTWWAFEFWSFVSSSVGQYLCVRFPGIVIDVTVYGPQFGSFTVPVQCL
jgi:hypothetical protein